VKTGLRDMCTGALLFSQDGALGLCALLFNDETPTVYLGLYLSLSVASTMPNKSRPIEKFASAVAKCSKEVSLLANISQMLVSNILGRSLR
jgi:hypothetical protein